MPVLYLGLEHAHRLIVLDQSTLLPEDLEPLLQTCRLFRLP